MRKLINLFRKRNIILIAAIGFSLFSIKNITNTSTGFKELILHQGIVENKSINTEDYPNRNSVTTLKLKLQNDENIYSISFQAQGAFNIIYEGDSVGLYTKKIKVRRAYVINVCIFRNKRPTR